MPSSEDDERVRSLPYETPSRRRPGWGEGFALDLAINVLSSFWLLLCVAGIGLIALLNLGSAWTFICTVLFLAAMVGLWRLMRRWTRW